MGAMQNAAATMTDTTALLAVIRTLQQENDYLRLQLAKARRERFGRSSERAGDLLAQLPLLLGGLAPFLRTVCLTSQAAASNCMGLT